MTRLDRSIVLFDGRCGFCAWSVEFARKKVHADIEFVAYQTVDVRDYGLTEEQCAQAVQFVSPRGPVAGEIAVAEVLKSGRGVWKLLGSVMASAPVRPAAGIGYRFIARHRGRLWGVTPPLS